MSDGRIRDERFCQGRRRAVDYSKFYADGTGLVATDPTVQGSLVEITRCLKEGNLIPEKYYRNGIDRDTDHLLQNHGIKHLHLHPDTDVDCLLYLIEYQDSVLYLEVDEHGRHFNKPAGSVLSLLHQSEIANADAKAAANKAAKEAAAKRGLLPKRTADERKGDE